jgi:hypothetical protein
MTPMAIKTPSLISRSSHNAGWPFPLRTDNSNMEAYTKMRDLPSSNLHGCVITCTLWRGGAARRRPARWRISLMERGGGYVAARRMGGGWVRARLGSFEPVHGGLGIKKSLEKFECSRLENCSENFSTVVPMNWLISTNCGDRYHSRLDSEGSFAREKSEFIFSPSIPAMAPGPGWGARRGDAVVV